jgi:hypothetical protein
MTAGVDNGTYRWSCSSATCSTNEAVTRFAQCAEQVCGAQTYSVLTRPASWQVVRQKF